MQHVLSVVMAQTVHHILATLLVKDAVHTINTHKHDAWYHKSTANEHKRV